MTKKVALLARLGKIATEGESSKKIYYRICLNGQRKIFLTRLIIRGRGVKFVCGVGPTGEKMKIPFSMICTLSKMNEKRGKEIARQGKQLLGLMKKLYPGKKLLGNTNL